MVSTQVISYGSFFIGSQSYSNVQSYTTQTNTIRAGATSFSLFTWDSYPNPNPIVYVTSIAPSEGATQRYVSPSYRKPVTLTISRGSRYFLYTLSEAVPFSIEVTLLYGSIYGSTRQVEAIPAGVTSFNSSLRLESYDETFFVNVFNVAWSSSDTTVLWTPQGNRQV